MRPDPHKRKKNSQYKKKHGINRDENEDGETQSQNRSSTERTVTESRRSEEKDIKPKKEPERTNTGRNGVEQNQDSQQDPNSKDNDEDSKSHSFSRRKIVSNWNRYGEPIKESSDTTEDKSQLRGADFASLVQQGANAASQFRLQEEKEWDLQGDNEIGSSLLVLDCNSLYSKLQKLPLHLRLNIDEKAFDKQSLQIFHEAVSSTSGNTDKTFFTNFKPNSESNFNSLENNIDNNAKEETKIIPEVRKSSAKIILPENLDDELDSLLNLEIPGSSSKTFTNPVISQSKEKREKIVRTRRILSTTTTSKPAVKKNEPEDSYDWLDSLLN